jgi:hypothetical protein
MRSARAVIALLVALSGVQALAIKCASCATMPCCDEEPSSQAKIGELPPCCRIVKSAEAPSRVPTLLEHQSQLGPVLATAWPLEAIAPQHHTVARIPVRVATSPPIYRLTCSLLL